MSTFLFSIPSFTDGIASVIDLFGTLPEYNTSSSPENADNRAVNADFMALQSDANVALSIVTRNVI